MPYNKLFINLACSVCTEKYRTSVFFYKPRPIRARSVPWIVKKSFYYPVIFYYPWSIQKGLGPIFLYRSRVRLIRS